MISFVSQAATSCPPRMINSSVSFTEEDLGEEFSFGEEECDFKITAIPVRRQTAVRRSTSQKRKRQHVSFQETVTVVQVPRNDAEGALKAAIWYSKEELMQDRIKEVKLNVALRFIRGPDFVLEENNLSWRGLEDHCPNNYGRFQRRVAKIDNHVKSVLGAAENQKHKEEMPLKKRGSKKLLRRSFRRSRRQHNRKDPVAMISLALSRGDRDAALAQGRKDAFEVRKDDGMEDDEEVARPTRRSNARAQPGSKSKSREQVSFFRSFATWFCYSNVQVNTPPEDETISISSSC